MACPPRRPANVNSASEGSVSICRSTVVFAVLTVTARIRWSRRKPNCVPHEQPNACHLSASNRSGISICAIGLFEKRRVDHVSGYRNSRYRIAQSLAWQVRRQFPRPTVYFYRITTSTEATPPASFCFDVQSAAPPVPTVKQPCAGHSRLTIVFPFSATTRHPELGNTSDKRTFKYK